jgi:hypothetical protein
MCQLANVTLGWCKTQVFESNSKITLLMNIGAEQIKTPEMKWVKDDVPSRYFVCVAQKNSEDTHCNSAEDFFPHLSRNVTLLMEIGAERRQEMKVAIHFLMGFSDSSPLRLLFRTRMRAKYNYLLDTTDQAAFFICVLIHLRLDHV